MSNEQKQKFIFVDFEASSVLGWPIEIGWAQIVNGQVIVENHLIRPEQEWDEAEWDEVSADVHGISLQQLEKEGLPAAIVADRVAKAFSGYVLISDAEDADSRWLARLMEAHSEEREWVITDLRRLRSRVSPSMWNRLEAELAQHSVTHRAGEDASRLAHAWLAASKE